MPVLQQLGKFGLQLDFYNEYPEIQFSIQFVVRDPEMNKTNIFVLNTKLVHDADTNIRVLFSVCSNVSRGEWRFSLILLTLHLLRC